VSVVTALAIAALSWRSISSRTLWEEAQRAARQEDWAAVEAWLGRSSEPGRPNPAVLRLRAHAAWKLGRPDDALRWLDRVPPDSPMAAAVQLQRGLILMDLLRIREADSAFLACLARDPLADEARRQRLTILSIERRFEEYDHELQQLGDESEARRLLSLILLASSPPFASPTLLVPGSRPDDELAVLHRWLGADPENPAVRPLLAEQLRRQGRLDEAVALLEPWLDSHPDDLAAREEWLELRLANESTEEIHRWLDPIPPNASHRPQFWRIRGDWLSQHGRSKEAIASYAEAARIEPRDVEIAVRLGLALRNQGEAAQAEQSFERARKLRALRTIARRIADHPETPRPDLWGQAGQLCEQLGRTDEARRWFDLNPDSNRSQVTLRREPDGARQGNHTSPPPGESN
jgi:tetratricopeptide (TPR) repeat protein